MKPLVVDMSLEQFLWTSNQEQWTLLELVHSVNSSDPTTLSSVKPVLETTGLKVTILKELNSLTQFLMLPERKLKDVIAFKVSKSPTHSVVEQVQVWVPSSFQRSEKNILTESCKPSQSSPHQKSLTQSSNHTTLLFQSINWSKTLMSAWSLITKPFMISASELLNSQPQPMVILTIWSQLLCQVLPAVLDSQVNLTPILENSLLTWFHSRDCTSSWLVSLPLPQEDLNNTELLQFQNSLNKCSMPRIWCALLILDTVDIWLLLPSSEEECQLKKSTNKCWTSKTRTLHISFNGFLTILSHPFAIFHQRDWRWLSLSLETQLPFKRCSRELLNNSQLCSEEKLSCIGIPEKVWMRWNSLRPNPTWTISLLNINNIKMPPLKKKVNSMKKRLDPFYYLIIFLKYAYFMFIS